MRAWQVHQHGEPTAALRLVDVPVPAPGPGQFRVRVTATGIGMPDVFMCRGVYPLTPTMPFTPGQEVVGEVSAVGEGVDLEVGSRVMAVTAFPTGHGGFADEALAYPHTAFPVPDGLADVDAAGFWIPHLTAWVGLILRGELRAAECVVVLGAAGGTGAAAVQVARASGARVIAVVGDDAKAELCRSIGAEVVLDHHAGPLAPRIQEATGGRGADIVFDPVGGATGEDAAKALARYGRFLAVGFASGSWPSLDVHRLVQTNASLVGVIAAGYDQSVMRDIHRRLSELVGRGELRSTVTLQVPFDELPRGLEQLANREVVGKAVLLGA